MRMVIQSLIIGSLSALAVIAAFSLMQRFDDSRIPSSNAEPQVKSLPLLSSLGPALRERLSAEAADIARTHLVRRQFETMLVGAGQQDLPAMSDVQCVESLCKVAFAPASVEQETRLRDFLAGEIPDEFFIESATGSHSARGTSTSVFLPASGHRIESIAYASAKP
jgi:hypothetical protein